MNDTTARTQFEANLASIVDRTASKELLELVASNDQLRDTRHAAEQVARLIQHAGDDFRDALPKGFMLDLPSRAPVPSEGGEVEKPSVVAVATAEPSPPKPAPSMPVSGVGAAGEAKATSEPSGSAKNVNESAKAERGISKPEQTGGTSGLHAALWIAFGIAGVLGLTVILLLQSAKKSSHASRSVRDLSGVVSRIETPSTLARVEICEGEKRACRDAEVKSSVGPGNLIRTNSRARANLELGDLTVGLERSTTVLLPSDDKADLRVATGTVAFERKGIENDEVIVDVVLGQLGLGDADCVVTSDDGRAVVEVTRGRVRVFDKDGHESILRVGEVARMRTSQRIQIDYSRNTTGALMPRDELEIPSSETDSSRGLGELRAKKPGETKERDNAVRLVRHHARVNIVGPIARTEIDETFANETNEVLEGIFRVPLPADAQIERLALEVDGKLVEGAFTDRERAGAIWRGSIVQAAPQLKSQIHDEIVWVPGPWRDPALLEWQRGNRFELRIFPIPKQGSRRVVLSYTQLVPAVAGARRYSYPLPRQGAGARNIEDFSIKIALRGHDAARQAVVSGYEGKLSSGARDGADFDFMERNFQPRGDLVIDYEVPEDSKSVVAWAHRSGTPGESPYFAMLLRPTLPRLHDEGKRSYAFVLDTSRSMVGESLRRATAVTVDMIRGLPADSEVVVLACDSDCRSWSDEPKAGGRSTAEAIRPWLASQTAEGASDLAGSVEAAVNALKHRNNESRHVVYVGDGTPTAGPTRSATLMQEARRLMAVADISMTAVAIGTDSDLESLRAFARNARGIVVPYVPGTSPAQVSSAAIAATLGTRLVGPRLELPSGFASITPRELDIIAAGDELLVVGRLDTDEVAGDVVLRGIANGRDFEQRYPLQLRTSKGEQNAFVPRLYAARRVTDLERRGDATAKSEAIELSRRFSVASRYTSLLVLESAAMFKAFGLDNERKSEIWSGELESHASVSDAVGDESEFDAEVAPAMGAPARAAAAPAAPSPKRSSAAHMEMSDAFSAKSAEPMSNRGRALAQDEGESRWKLPSSPPPRPRMIPMRRIWERKGEVQVGRDTPSTVTEAKIVALEADVARDPDRRNTVKQLFDLYQRSNRVEKADELARKWSERDPLDVEALVARADLAARRGDRELAIRILGSVVDVRPNDIGAQQRLGRLYRWQGQGVRACRFSLALAEFRPSDETALTDAVRCLSEEGRKELVEALRENMSEPLRRAVELRLGKPRAADQLGGDFRITARWQSSSPVDIDLGLIDPDAHRVSWLGAPTRAVITATDVTSPSAEGLSLRGAKAGEYVLEVVRGKGTGRASGVIKISVAGTTREVPFTLEGERDVVGLVKVVVVPRLVPLPPSTAFRLNE